MNTHNAFGTNPGIGNCCGDLNDPIVDKLIGNAYYVVKFVAMRMPFIKTVSDNIDHVIAIATALDQLKALEDKLPELLALREKLAQLMQLYDHLNELLAISTNLPQLLAVYDNLDNIQVIVDNLTSIKTVSTEIASILAVATNINAVKNLDANMAAILNVNNNTTPIKNVSDNMVDVRNVSTNMVQVKNVSDNMAEILAVYAKLPDLANINANLNSALQDIATFKGATGSNSIGHTPATGPASTVGATLRTLRADVDGKAATGASYTKSESDAKYPTKTDLTNGLSPKANKTIVWGVNGDPVDKKATRLVNTWYKNDTDHPIMVFVTVTCTTAGTVRLVADIRKDDTQTDPFTIMAQNTPSMAVGGVIGESFVVPPQWEFRFISSNADTVHQWLEY
ncbi:putative tail fiber protein [Achromobacter phage vB_AxyP_19-32_Axy22]|uniref:Putative tail fiber protein n=1 Tax=Achromobacter phage vB_AxyP_19-32_Axy22 TaxID=2591046 RepID=A0A514CVU6_9CAUD|nr:putative tail fiber protein [Achromobacter phage vB_AxyP_19-32_Axy22]